MLFHLLLLFFTKKYSFISLCLKPEMWQKVAKFKGAENFRKALYMFAHGTRFQFFYLDYCDYSKQIIHCFQFRVICTTCPESS